MIDVCVKYRVRAGIEAIGFTWEGEGRFCRRGET